MAVPTNTVTEASLTSKREDLMDMVYNISPSETPFVSKAGRENATAALKEWSVVSLRAAKNNKRLDGDAFSGDSRNKAAKRGNYLQISTEDIEVSDRSDQVSTPGSGNEMAAQTMRARLEIRRDVEFAALTRQKSNVESGTTKAQSAGVPTWCRTNDSLGAGGSPASATLTNGVPSTAGTIGTTDRGLTETLILTAVQNCYSQGGRPDVLLVGLKHKQMLSKYLLSSSSSAATARGPISQDAIKSGAGAAVAGGVKYWNTDYGTMEIIPDHFIPVVSGDEDVFVLDMQYWSIAYLRGYSAVNIAKAGLSTRRMIVADWCVVAKNEASSAVISACNTTTAIAA